RRNRHPARLRHRLDGARPRARLPAHGRVLLQPARSYTDDAPPLRHALDYASLRADVCFSLRRLGLVAVRARQGDAKPLGVPAHARPLAPFSRSYGAELRLVIWFSLSAVPASDLGHRLVD